MHLLNPIASIKKKKTTTVQLACLQWRELAAIHQLFPDEKRKIEGHHFEFDVISQSLKF